MLSIITHHSSLQNQHMFYGEGSRAVKETTTGYHHSSTDISRNASGHISWTISLCFLLLPITLHCRTNTCSMEKGLELSKRQLQAIITQSTDISRHASGRISWTISLCFLLLPIILHCRTNTCSMEKGLELSKSQLQAIITQVQTFLDMHQVISAGPFLYAFYYYPSFFIVEPAHVLWRRV